MYHDKWHICYADNYFNGIPLLTALYDRGIHTVGTLRVNRLKSRGNIYYDKKGANKGIRGNMKQHQISDHTFVTSWWDKRPVNMLHSFETMKDVCKRHDADPVTGEHKITEVERPTIIKHYNAGMGGTDGMDQYLAYYRTSVKTKRWPHCIIFHFLLASVTNAFIMHKEANKLTKHDQDGNLFSFMMSVVDEWCRLRTEDEIPVCIVDPAPRHCSSSNISATDPRFVGKHWPLYLPRYTKDKKRLHHTCSLPGCTRRTSSYCKTCGVTLCFNAMEEHGDTSCFEAYHTPP